MKQANLDQLRANPATAKWPEPDLKALASAIVIEHYQQGTVLCRQGRPGACCWLVLDGQLEVARAVAGHRMEVARAGVGEWVGQLSLIDGAPRAATVVAATDIEVAVMTRDIFEQLLASQAPVALRFQRHVAMTATSNLRAAGEHLAKVHGLVDQHGLLSPADLYTVRKRRAGPKPTHHGIRWAAPPHVEAPPHPDHQPAQGHLHPRPHDHTGTRGH
ncbi:MAG: cyclic nucleotide-binding domain-containing protein [Deltaproteobacteria bacterium]|nr:cyclic nucleotide-binding domain-containing protein [Deltaproteobacteria bacterium]